ncbi:MAG: hypothetical protein AAF842_12545, partial [Planctomycetota bacterium]
MIADTSVTAGAGDISAVVGGQFTAALDADSTDTGPVKGGRVDALAMASFAGSIDAEADASVTVLGNSTGTIAANQDASASGPGAASTLTVIGDGSSGGASGGASAGNITGSVTSAFGSLNITASGDLAAAVSAGADGLATQGSADVTVSGSVTSAGDITAHTNATLLAFGTIAGDVTATHGRASVTTADALNSATITAGTDASVSALKESDVTITSGTTGAGDLSLSLSGSAGDEHTIDLTAAGGIQANIIADTTGPVTTTNGGDADLFVLGEITGNAAYTVAGRLEVLASAGMALGDVSGTQGVDLSTPAALQAASVGSSAGSAEVFAGTSVSVGLGSGAITAYDSLSVSSRGAISASQLTTTTGDITVATQSSYAVAADAGGDLSIVALGSINEAAYTAGRDATLISLGDIHTNTAAVDAGRSLRLLAKGNIDADNVTADTIALLHAEGDVSGDFDATTEIDRVIVHGDMTATLTEAGSTYIYDEPDQPGVDPFTWSAKGEAYSLDHVRADLMALDESLLSLAEQITKALTGTSEQQGATTADLTKAQADLNAALGEATASAQEAFASVTKGVNSAVSDTNATFARISYETAISLSRGVTDSQASLADLTMQVSDQAVRSGETLIQATSGLNGAITQIGNARQENQRLFNISNSAVSNSLDKGKDFRDDNFNHAALAAIESIEKIEREELLNRLQFVLALLGAIPGPIGIGFNLLNAEISKARGNAEAARDYTIYAIPFVGGVYGLGQLGVMLGQYTASKISQAISAPPNEQTQLPIVHRINWVSGPGGGNSFVAGTGVVTGVDEDGNLITTSIEDLQVGD